MKKIVFLLLLAGLFAACNPEKLKVEGNIKNAKDGVVLVKMKSHNKGGDRILDTLKLASGDFDFYSEEIKPPVKLTFIVNDDEEFDLWLGKYGSYNIKGEQGALKNIEVFNSNLHNQIKETKKQFYDWYIRPVQDKIDWLNSQEKEIRSGKVLNTEELFKKMEFEKKVKKAYKIRRLSIVKTARKNPGSDVALALVNEEFNNLVPRHKKEMIKLFRRKFGDTALFWQLKP
jgi:acylphosphatase